MMRGTFANIRIKNEMLAGVEGGYHQLRPRGEQMSIYDAAMRYKAEGMPLVIFAGQGIRHRLVARLGGQGHGAAGRQGGDRRELRAHPPLEPRRHGRAAADLPSRRGPQALTASPARSGSTSSGSRTSSRARSCDMVIHRTDGTEVRTQVLCRVDTADEVEYYRQGGILQYVLRTMAGVGAAA